MACCGRSKFLKKKRRNKIFNSHDLLKCSLSFIPILNNSFINRAERYECARGRFVKYEEANPLLGWWEHVWNNLPKNEFHVKHFATGRCNTWIHIRFLITSVLFFFMLKSVIPFILQTFTPKLDKQSLDRVLLKSVQRTENCAKRDYRLN